MYAKFMFLSTVAVALAILTGSLLPDLGIQNETMNLDKVVHAGAYLVLGFLLFQSLSSVKFHAAVNAGICLAACVFFGGIIEILQNFTGRTTDLVDLAADAAGASSGTVVSWFFSRTVLRKKRVIP